MTIEELQQQVLEMQERLSTLTTEKVELENTVREKEQREKELMEHNQKLFLKVTSKVEDKKEEKEEDVPFCLDKETYKLLDKFDREILNELIEGDNE